ncbi:hypothetical protein RB653_000320 [Dictyostelium firmibasis]|uniref:Enoyl reductase (ER) domain-containing protein n=1 Tax=Dictyostelium firmibasis TaxID=79012 RepID=A0AAN7TV25_9MYCE
MVLSKQIVLKNYIESGTPTLEDFEEKTVKISTEELQAEEIVVRLEIVSPDPYMRGRMTSRKSYIPPFEIGKPISGYGIGKVTKAGSSSKYAVGDYIMGQLPWQEEFIYNSNSPYVNKIDSTLAPLESFLSVLGMVGLTAYHGLKEIGEPKQGETVVVSGAAGAVGQLVVQICKIKGCKVVGIAGSDDKIKYLVEELGLDAGVNYNSPTYKLDLGKAVPNGIDVYWENVGGVVSDAVWPLLNKFARIPLCGVISQYNNTEMEVGPRIEGYLLKTSSKLQGFIVSNYISKNGEALKQLAEWYKSGQIKDRHTVDNGFSQIVPSFLALFKGTNTGKMMVKLT